MKEQYVRADRFLIVFRTNCPSVIAYLNERIDDFFRLTISFSNAECGEPDMWFIYEDDNRLSIEFQPQEHTIRLSCPWDQISQSTILPMVFRLIVEWLRQREGEIKLHASAVEKNGIAALFLAPSEGGKTTTAMAMCQKYNCLLRANDAAVVKLIHGVPQLLRGDTAFRVRYNGLEAYSIQIFNSKTKGNTSADTPWYNKLSLSPAEIGVETSTKTVPVHFIFFVRLDMTVDGVQVSEFSLDYEMRRKLWFKPMMMVLQNIAGTIRGSDLIPVDNYGMLLPLVIPSLDAPELAMQRSVFVNTLFTKCRVYQLRGQLNPMAAFINQVLEQEPH